MKTGREPTEPRPLPRDRTPHLTPHTCPPCVCCIRGHRRGRFRERVSSLACDTTRVDVCGRASGRAAAARRHGTPDTLRTPSGHTTTVATEHSSYPSEGGRGGICTYPHTLISNSLSLTQGTVTVGRQSSVGSPRHACSVAYRRLTFSIASVFVYRGARGTATGQRQSSTPITDPESPNQNHIRITDEGGAASGAGRRRASRDGQRASVNKPIR